MVFLTKLSTARSDNNSIVAFKKLSVRQMPFLWNWLHGSRIKSGSGTKIECIFQHNMLTAKYFRFVYWEKRFMLEIVKWLNKITS